MAKRVSTTDSKYYTAELYDGSRKTFVQSESRIKTVKEFSFIGLVVLLLIIFSIIGILQGRSDQRTFYSFLEMLSNVPEVQIGFTDLINTNLNFPSWLNWAEKILEIGAGFLGLLGFFLEGLISATMYLWYFVRWIFVV